MCGEREHAPVSRPPHAWSSDAHRHRRQVVVHRRGASFGAPDRSEPNGSTRCSIGARGYHPDPAAGVRRDPGSHINQRTSRDDGSMLWTDREFTDHGFRDEDLGDRKAERGGVPTGATSAGSTSGIRAPRQCLPGDCRSRSRTTLVARHLHCGCSLVRFGVRQLPGAAARCCCSARSTHSRSRRSAGRRLRGSRPVRLLQLREASAGGGRSDARAVASANRGPHRSPHRWAPGSRGRRPARRARTANFWTTARTRRQGGIWVGRWRLAPPRSGLE